jgi:alginate O-acetyltransferase complex protein AlgI
MLFSGSIDFFLGMLIGREYEKGESNNFRPKLYLFFSLALNLGILIYFKYSGFFLEVINSTLRLFNYEPASFNMGVILPLGISFYTFQSMSYTIDVYRKEVKYQKNYDDFLTFVTMFPQLVAGPIVRYSEVSKSLVNRHVKGIDLEIGMKRFIKGLCKKVIIANTIGVYADNVFSLQGAYLDTPTAWLGAIAYSLQIFFDFSGYSDMAIGLGKIFGFNFPENFNYPYMARSVQDFWRRWHMSLSRWFRDYLYLPLGGSRKGQTRTFLNLFIVFFLCGLWHGASYNFIAWGIFHGLFLVFERLEAFSKVKDIKFLNRGYTLFVVIIGWVFFRSNDLTQALLHLEAMFSFDNLSGFYNWFKPDLILALVLGIFFSVDFRSRLQLKFFILQKKSLINLSYFFGLLFSIFLIAGESYNPFIYFRF